MGMGVADKHPQALLEPCCRVNGLLYCCMLLGYHSIDLSLELVQQLQRWGVAK